MNGTFSSRNFSSPLYSISIYPPTGCQWPSCNLDILYQGVSDARLNIMSISAKRYCVLQINLLCNIFIVWRVCSIPIFMFSSLKKLFGQIFFVWLLHTVISVHPFVFFFSAEDKQTDRLLLCYSFFFSPSLFHASFTKKKKTWPLSSHLASNKNWCIDL